MQKMEKIKNNEDQATSNEDHKIKAQFNSEMEKLVLRSYSFYKERMNISL